MAQTRCADILLRQPNLGLTWLNDLPPMDYIIFNSDHTHDLKPIGRHKGLKYLSLAGSRKQDTEPLGELELLGLEYSGGSQKGFLQFNISNLNHLVLADINWGEANLRELPERIDDLLIINANWLESIELPDAFTVRYVLISWLNHLNFSELLRKCGRVEAFMLMKHSKHVDLAPILNELSGVRALFIDDVNFDSIRGIVKCRELQVTTIRPQKGIPENLEDLNDLEHLRLISYPKRLRKYMPARARDLPTFQYHTDELTGFRKTYAEQYLSPPEVVSQNW